MARHLNSTPIWRHTHLFLPSVSNPPPCQPDPIASDPGDSGSTAPAPPSFTAPCKFANDGRAGSSNMHETQRPRPRYRSFLDPASQLSIVPDDVFVSGRRHEGGTDGCVTLQSRHREKYRRKANETLTARCIVSFVWDYDRQTSSEPTCLWFYDWQQVVWSQW